MYRMIVIAASACLLVAGCAQKDGSTGVDVNAVQDYTKKACGFLPVAETVLNIFATRSPELDTTVEIATAICASVNTPRGPGTPPMVKGVVVKGSRV